MAPTTFALPSRASAASALPVRGLPRRAWRRVRRLHAHKLPLFLGSLYLFVVALALMKEGAGSLGPLVRDGLRVTGFADALGLGWLLAYVIMSGSPVAGVAMVFLDQGVLDRLGAYGMIVGSRFGASFVVLFLGFLYVLRGRSPASSLGMGVLSLSVAASVQVLAIPLGLVLLVGGFVDGAQLGSTARLTDLTEALTAPVTALVAAWLPPWGLFGAGLALMLLSFNLFDRAVPEMSLRESGAGSIARFVYRPWVMFALGSAVTLVSMSVSISLGLLVPLGQRGLVRRENVVPYIMGANISTFVDTLLAAVLIGNPEAFTVVLVEMLSLAAVAALILLVAYERYERALLGLVAWATERPRNLGLFLAVLWLVPLVLVLR